MINSSLRAFKRVLVQNKTQAYKQVYFSTFLSGTPRQEKDTFGPIEVPGDKYWGAQTQRSL